MKRANAIAHVATMDGEPTLASHLSNKRAISLEKGGGDIHQDERCTAPIYNYARFLPWTLAVEDVYYAFREASERSDRHQAVSGATWEMGDRHMNIRPENRRGSLTQVAAYVKPTIKPATFYASKRSRWGPGVISRFLLASLLALSLTWGSVGAAILVAFFTPTKGRSRVVATSISYYLSRACLPKWFLSHLRSKCNGCLDVAGHLEWPRPLLHFHCQLQRSLYAHQVDPLGWHIFNHPSQAWKSLGQHKRYLDCPRMLVSIRKLLR